MDTQHKLTKLLALYKVADSVGVTLTQTKKVIQDEIDKICYTCGSTDGPMYEKKAYKKLCPRCSKKYNRGQLCIL